MTDKKRTDQQASPQISHVSNTSTEAQRSRLLAWPQAATDHKEAALKGRTAALTYMDRTGHLLVSA